MPVLKQAKSYQRDYNVNHIKGRSTLIINNLTNFNKIIMGRGDKKTKKGKIAKGSFGKSRPAKPAKPKKEKEETSE